MVFSAVPSRLRHPVAAVFALGLAGFALSGCSWFDKGPKVCPRVSILADAAQMTDYRPGGGRDVTDIVFQGEVSSVSAECKYDKDDKVINMTTTLTLVAERGAAPLKGDVNLPFFVAVIDRKTQKVLNKNIFQSPVPFPPGHRRSGVSEEISERIPVTAGHTIVDYEILVGLQLTEEQLEINRKQQGS
ncbi:MAG TPA: hypothetical protein VMU42_12760 [Candidatus Sulfotelmatobacter sp.]|nr:hypothetical protein [Candidatus Sulfotelmatobacter sp.]